jgi:hypothetical protein
MPKAAGSTLTQIILRQYEPSTAFTAYVGDEQARSVIKELPLEQRKRIRVVIGHLPFGTHTFFPQPCAYFTVLRDPVDRLISWYYFVRQSPDHDHYRFVTSQQLSLKEYILSDMVADNGQTRRLAGIVQPSRRVPTHDEPCTTKDLKVAKKNLQEHFAVVGLSERFDETLLLLKRALGWKTPFYVSTNITKSRPSKDDIERDTLEVLEQHTELDIELYRYAQELFEKQVGEYGPSFDRDRAIFGSLNEMYGAIHALSRPVKRATRSLVKPSALGFHT